MAQHILSYRIPCGRGMRARGGGCWWAVVLAAAVGGMGLALAVPAVGAASPKPAEKAPEAVLAKSAEKGAAAAGEKALGSLADTPADPTIDPPPGPLGPADAVYPRGPAEMEPLIRADPLRFLQTARDWAAARIRRYTCRFQKLERIDGELQRPETMRMKFRADPFSVYLKWTADPSKGQEVIFVRGKYADKAVVHPSGLIGKIFRKVSIDPEGKIARKHSRRPITMAGMVYMIQLITGQCEEAQRRGDLTLTYEGIRHDGGRPSYLLKRVLPKDKGYPCKVLLIFVDCQTLACVRTDAYDWGGEILSHYFYTDLQINPDLPDDAFDPNNPDYGYRYF